ncbi:guanylate kinase [bacterium]|nr:guanylate kinase [bacterium]
MSSTHKKAPLIVVSGASGSGKTTLCRMIADKLGYYYGVSHTTRPMRVGEVHGRDYYFLSQDDFKAMVEKGDFLEWALVYGNMYGTSRVIVDEHRKKGMGVILDVDTVGARNIKKASPDAVLIFISVPSLDVLKSRLESRGTESPEMLAKRMGQALNEENCKTSYDFVIVNDNLESSYKALEKLVKNAEN